MGTLLATMSWMDKADKLDALLQQDEYLTVHTMQQGYEAEVMRISSDDEDYVLKMWNRGSKPDIRFQFRLLQLLDDQGLSVPKPLGWGIDSNGDQVLLTSYGGTAIRQADKKKMVELANLLSNIHQTKLDNGSDIQLPKYELIDYFFPGVRESQNKDVEDALHSIIEITTIRQNQLIHGDFHFGNIVEQHDQYIIIDWTNAQLGDKRYDFAWTLLVLTLFISAEKVQVFRSAYLLNHDIPQQELDCFEALACLRWILLMRCDGVPKSASKLVKLRGIIANNRHLRHISFDELALNRKIRSSDGMELEAVFGQYPNLKSDDLILKKMEQTHLNELYEIYSNDAVFEYCGIIPKHNKDTVSKMIGHFDRDYNKQSRVKWGIFAHSDSERLLGIIEAFDFDQRVNMVTVGYYLAESSWGKGLASEALRIVVQYLFAEVSVNRIQAEVMPLNEGSKRVLLKNGFVKEGLLRQASFWSGKGVVDLEMYSILRGD